ncbi:MAG: cupin domain-containing protein [Alphaproteobacteria bacterium]|nr:cupin domain-containing protein [Alphaproteobacteria bacterium]MDX5368802.1 cupin domain-containing protein [Alphaproteobacteria bacterium]
MTGAPPARFALADALAAVPQGTPVPAAEIFAHGTMKLEFYAPRGEDRQQPHVQDELYIVQQGSGVFLRGEERFAFGPGDALFVRAGVVHRFEDFSDDLAVWVVFWGADGGEAA